MLFSGIPFLYCFLPLVVLVYFLVPRGLKNTVLLLFSLVFYGWGEPKYVFLMLATIAAFYGCGLAIHKAETVRWKKVWLIVAVAVGIGLLAVFKTQTFLLRTSMGSPVFLSTCCGWRCRWASASIPSRAFPMWWMCTGEAFRCRKIPFPLAPM